MPLTAVARGFLFSVCPSADHPILVNMISQEHLMGISPNLMLMLTWAWGLLIRFW